jgi:hypothetical protein
VQVSEWSPQSQIDRDSRIDKRIDRFVYFALASKYTELSSCGVDIVIHFGTVRDPTSDSEPMKTAIVILSDPKAGAEESLGRLFNALAFADESRAGGDEVEIVFKGAGTRWPGELVKLGHPANARYQSVRELVKGASLGCATKFGVKDDVVASGVALLSDTALAGSPGVAGLRRYYAEGWNVTTF